MLGKKYSMVTITKKDVIYVPGIWKILMSIILLIPERIFKKLDF